MNVIKADICALIDSFQQLDAIDKIITIAQEPTRITRYGRRYSRVFFSRHVKLSVHLDKLGKFLLEFPSGWNPFEVPDGTEIALLGGQEPLDIIHHLSDSEIIPM